MHLRGTGHFSGVWKTPIANSREQRIVPNSANSVEQCQIVADSDERSSTVTPLDLISSVNYSNYPNKQQNSSEFITFSSQDSG